MIIRFYLLFFVLFSFTVRGQVDSLHFSKKKIAVRDSIIFFKVSTNPYFFNLQTIDGISVDTLAYKVDFSRSKLYLKPQFYIKYPQTDSLFVSFYTYPDFLTKTYRGYDPNLVVPDNPFAKPIAVESKKNKPFKKPFAGLDTQGNVVRGITIGNNQDAVLNSTLDLKIEGKLSSKVSLRARINDTNIPIQENGYSQDLKDLDRVYIEMEGPKWSIKAGDIFFKNRGTYFMNFSKKVSGVSVDTKLDSTRFLTSGAVVKGRFTTYKFQGQEANQGPYKLKGNTGEAYIFIINGSEKVYVNGILQKRGKDKDYLIDYNTAEITFTATNPITSDMRIRVEFQYSDRNYTRFVTHNGIQHNGKKLQIGAYFYRESDVKTQPLQLNLTDEQIALLAAAGNTGEQLLVTNAVETDYAENKILYRKIVSGTDEIFEYSTDADETLYLVGFTYVGAQQGDYSVEEYLASGKKMIYVGDTNGDYVAATPLVAPSKQQIALINTHYQPSRKTDLSVELAYSDNDSNLFSTIGNDTNRAPAIKMSWKQLLMDTTATGWRLKAQLQYDFLHKNFKSIERIFAIEFDRDWNLTMPLGNQSLLTTQLYLSNKKSGEILYAYENLNFTENYKGNKHRLEADLHFKNYDLQHKTSYLQSNGSLYNTKFVRTNTAVNYIQKKWWLGAVFDFEDNKQNISASDELNNFSYRFSDFQGLVGVGDSAKVFVKLGVNFRTNDSLQNSELKRVNKAKTWFINSQLIKKKNAQLQIYTNYRSIDYLNGTKTDALNSRLLYNQQLFQQFLSLQTNYQNISGNVPQQEYAYIETEPGQGYYTWIDYNANGIQELDEFEVAQFSDQANFLRIALPNIQYIATQEARLQQSLQLNFSKWSNQEGFKKILSHWSNQLTILARNNKIRNEEVLHLNPFDFAGAAILELQYNLRNSLFYNRGKDKYTTTYHYTDLRQKTVHSFDTQENNIESHQLLFHHKIKDNWQIGFELQQSQNKSLSSAFNGRNFKIDTRAFSPSITYLIHKNHWIKTSYSFVDKENNMGEPAILKKQQLAFEYQYTNDKQTHFSATVKLLENNFTGSDFSAVGYQMLEGLQPGTNAVWSLLWSHKLNSFLFLNLNYNARANSFSRTIHNGNIQLRAGF